MQVLAKVGAQPSLIAATRESEKHRHHSPEENQTLYCFWIVLDGRINCDADVNFLYWTEMCSPRQLPCSLNGFMSRFAKMTARVCTANNVLAIPHRSSGEFG